MMKLGYARVSTNEQDTSAQVSALKSAGCEKIFREKASGGRWDRPELHRLLDQLRTGDVLVVSRLDRLSRSLRDLLMIMERIKTQKQDSGACPKQSTRPLHPDE
jgi:DNA invertase Pin-like site-specific DNA recombinase